MEKITNNTKNATRKYDSDYKISEDFVNKYRDSNFDAVMEKDHKSKEFQKMIDTMKRNMDFYNAYKEEKIRKDKRLLEALKVGDASLVDDLIKDDDLPLSTAEIKFLNDLEYDVDEASYIDSNLQKIENETCFYKKKNLILYLNNRDEENKNYQKYIEYKKHEKLFFQILDYIDSIDFDNTISEDDIRSKKRNYTIINKESKLLWKKYFDLFYTFGFNKLNKYFNNLVFSSELVMEMKTLVERHEWSEGNESVILPEEKLTEKLSEHDDEYREEQFVNYIKVQSYMVFKSLMLEFKKKRFPKIEQSDFKSKKAELDRCLKVAEEKSYETNLNLYTPSELAKLNKIDTVEERENFLSLNLQKKIYKLVSQIESINEDSIYKKNRIGNSIDIVNLNKIYKSDELNVHVLKDFNLAIKKGEFVVLLGSSGSGKTTLMNLMSGIDRITYGDVIVNDVNIRNLTNEKLTQFRKENIGYIFQRYGLIPNLTVYENIRIGAYLSNQKKNEKSNRPKILELEELDRILTLVDLAGTGDKYPHELSGGQQQRVSIARVIAKKPAIIFADEPTSALDEESSKKVISLLQMINRKYGITIVMITHDEKNVNYATREIYLKNGQIIKDIRKAN